MMGYRAPSKKAIKDAIKIAASDPAFEHFVMTGSYLDFWSRVQETSMFGAESKVPGDNLVVGPDAYTNRRWYATLTVDSNGIVTAIK